MGLVLDSTIRPEADSDRKTSYETTLKSEPQNIE